MPSVPLAGRLILIVEDEPLVALDVAKTLRSAGAKVLSAGYVESGLFSSEHPDLSAAVVDLRLGDGDGTAVCRRLHQMGVPFLLYTAYAPDWAAEHWPNVPVVRKPASPGQLVATLTSLLR